MAKMLGRLDFLQSGKGTPGFLLALDEGLLFAMGAGVSSGGLIGGLANATVTTVIRKRVDAIDEATVSMGLDAVAQALKGAKYFTFRSENVVAVRLTKKRGAQRILEFSQNVEPRVGYMTYIDRKDEKRQLVGSLMWQVFGDRYRDEL